jgi:hypothetical protein
MKTMLIDDILNNQSWKKGGVITSLRERLEKTPKFILRRDFAMAVDEIVHDNWKENADKIVPLCRIPYPECWIEVAQADRLADRIRPAMRSYEIQVKRVGWLFTQITPKGKWIAQMFWSVDPKDPNFQEVSDNCDHNFWGSAPLSAAMATMRFDPSASTAIEAMIPLGPSEFALNVIRFKGLRGLPEDMGINFKGTITDWEGEGSFIMGVLALLNSKNVVERTPVSFTKKNKAAKKAGQKLLHDHQVISIHTRYTKRNMDPATVNDGRKHRAHWCRGHFKIRKTGCFFWAAHRRGDMTAKPPKPKDYVVKK